LEQEFSKNPKKTLKGMQKRMKKLDHGGGKRKKNATFPAPEGHEQKFSMK